MQYQVESEKNQSRARKLERGDRKRESKFELEKLDRQERERERELNFELEKLILQHTTEYSSFRVEFDAAKNIRKIPKFQEKSVDKYFPLFEKLAENLKWPQKVWLTMLQSVLTGKAAEVYSALGVTESSDYDHVKSVISKEYELVPEAYRQKFRKYKKFDNQTFVEFS